MLETEFAISMTISEVFHFFTGTQLCIDRFVERDTIIKLNESFKALSDHLPSKERKHLENLIEEVRFSLSDRIKQIEQHQKTQGIIF